NASAAEFCPESDAVFLRDGIFPTSRSSDPDLHRARRSRRPVRRLKAHRNSRSFRGANAQDAAALHFPPTLTACASYSSASLVLRRPAQDLSERCPAWALAADGLIRPGRAPRWSELTNLRSCP